MDNRGEYKKAFREQALIERLRAENARLVAALQRLNESTEQYLAGHITDCELINNLTADLRNARAAIAKATGQRG